MKTLALLLIMVLFSFSCKQTPVQSSEIDRIAYGTSFGFCMGYCVKVMNIEGNLANKTLTSRNPDQPPKSCNETIDGSQLFTQIDLEAFRALPDTIGCPDCADGGSEWIEITAGGETKRVTFEYQREPQEVKSYISALREQSDSLGDCSL